MASSMTICSGVFCLSKAGKKKKNLSLLILLKNNSTEDLFRNESYV